MKRAFTLVELLVVIGIIGLLVAVLLPTFSNATEAGRTAKCLSNLKSLASAVQVYGGGHNYYPRAGSYEVLSFDESQGIRNVRELYSERKGWISWNSDGVYRSRPQSHVANYGWFTSAYDQDERAREYALTNGLLWVAMNGNSSCYRCPSHLKKMRVNKPNWSYVMNAYFGWDDSKGRFAKDEHHEDVRYGTLNRAERRLLFAELQWENYTGDTPDTSASAGTKNDCTLQYKGDDREAIGFNHKHRRDVYAHVAYADGHTDKIVWKRGQDLKQLTEWLCEGKDIALNAGTGRYEEMR